MRALTICQPYAHMIVRGEKLVENRDWFTPYRGPLAIHAGKSRAYTDRDEIQRYVDDGDPMAFGAVVGVARLIRVVTIESIRRGDQDCTFPWLRDHRHAMGPWCWVLADVRRFARPVPWKGTLGLFSVPDGIEGLLGDPEPVKPSMPPSPQGELL